MYLTESYFISQSSNVTAKLKSLAIGVAVEIGLEKSYLVYILSYSFSSSSLSESRARSTREYYHGGRGSRGSRE